MVLQPASMMKMLRFLLVFLTLSFSSYAEDSLAVYRSATQIDGFIIELELMENHHYTLQAHGSVNHSAYYFTLSKGVFTRNNNTIVLTDMIADFQIVLKEAERATLIVEKGFDFLKGMKLKDANIGTTEIGLPENYFDRNRYADSMKLVIPKMRASKKALENGLYYAQGHGGVVILIIADGKYSLFLRNILITEGSIHTKSDFVVFKDSGIRKYFYGIRLDSNTLRSISLPVVDEYVRFTRKYD